MKSIKPIQKYPPVIEPYSWILKIFVIIFLFPMIFLFFFGICSTLKLSKYITFSAFTYNAIQWVPIGSYWSRSIIYAPSFILDKLFLEYTPLKLVFFDNISNLVKEWGGIKSFITSSPALITPRPNYAFLNIQESNVPNKVGKNTTFCSFISFLLVSLIPFISNPDSSSNLTIIIISSIPSFEIVNAVVLDFFWIAASVADAAAVNPNGFKALLAYGVSSFFYNGKRAVINGLRKSRNSPFCLAIFLVIFFIKIFLFSKDSIIVIISFTLFVRVIPEPVFL